MKHIPPHSNLSSILSLLLVLFAVWLAVPLARGADPEPLPLLAPDSSPPQTVTASKPVILKPDSANWDLSKYDSVYVDLRNPGKEPVTVWARAENPEGKGMTDTVRAAQVVDPGQTETLRLRIIRRPKDPGYAPFKPFFMYTKNINVRDNTIDPSQIARIVVSLEPGSGDKRVHIESASAKGEGIARQPDFLPFIDKYGQYKHSDWPGKIHDDADLAERLKEEQAEMRAYPGPSNWNKWGGWADGPKQEKTGFFYPKKVDGKWWLVDPDGCLFWSYGTTGVGLGGEGSPVTGKEGWFEELPSPNGPYARYWSEGKGARFMYYEDGKPWKAFNFTGMLAEKKYGKDWERSPETVDMLHRRLRNWGFNTIGNWSASDVMAARRTPYTVAIHAGVPLLDHIPDVFHPDFEKMLRARMEKERGTTAGDPWNIGYFVDNELTWGHRNKAAIAIHNSLKFPKSATKKAFRDFLKKGHGTIDALNAAWGMSYASWDAFLETVEPRPDLKNPKVDEDCGKFGLIFAEKYFSTAAKVVKDVAPKNLYLGVRFHGHIDKALVQICARHADLISYNVYEDDPGQRVNQYLDLDLPFLVGEFGIGSDPFQTPLRGDKPTEDPRERVDKMVNYVRRAFVHPLLVGAHYFQFRDQPISGRPDGEAVLRGFINAADTPHFDLVQANRPLGYNMYEMRSGKK
jgi:Beta-galactosidase